MISLDFFASNVFIHEILHFLVAAMVAFLVYRKYKKPELILIIFFVSFLIDADHYLEGLIINRFGIGWIFREFAGTYWRISGKMTILFHGWEYLPLILLLGWKKKYWPLSVAVASAMLGHYLLDQSVYTLLHGMSLFEYSVIYRAVNHFDFKQLCPGC